MWFLRVCLCGCDSLMIHDLRGLKVVLQCCLVQLLVHVGVDVHEGKRMDLLRDLRLCVREFEC